MAGGWAVDLFLGRVTRAHGDVDVAVYRRDQAALHAFLREAGWEAAKVVAGRLEPWPAGERLELPVHEIHATRGGSAGGAGGGAAGAQRLEFLLNEGDAAVWRFRKAPAVVARARALVELRTGGGVPFLAPEVVLLYKATSAARRAADDLDFATLLPALGAERRGWLGGAIAALDPGHPWLAAL